MTRIAALGASRRQLIVALGNDRSKRSRVHLRADRTLQGRGQLAEHLAALCIAVVVPETLHRFDPIAAHLHAHGLFLWIAPLPFVDALTDLLGIRSPASLKLAHALARSPTIPILARQLHPLPPPDPRQLCLPILPHSS